MSAAVAVYQEYDPKYPGFVPMSFERAEYCMNEVVALIEQDLPQNN